MSSLRKLFKRKSVMVLTGIILVVVIRYVYKALQPAAPTRYVTDSVTKGTIIVTVNGSGQVSSSNQIDVKPKASGTVLKLPVKVGQTVKIGTILAQLDAKDAYKTVRDAQLNVETAQLSLQKLNQPPDDLSVTQSENSLAQAQESKKTSEEDLLKAYDDAYTSITGVFLDLPTIMTGLHDVLLGTNLSSSQSNIDYYADAVLTYDDKVALYHDDADTNYQTARVAYDANFNDYKIINRSSSQATIEASLEETYGTVKKIDTAIKSATNLIQFYKDKVTERGFKPNSLADTHLATLNTYTSKINSRLADLVSAKNNIKSDRASITNAERTITERTQSLAKLQSGPDSLDLQSSELSLRQRQASLSDALSALADYTVRAPIAGIVAKLNVKLGDPASSGSALATLVAKQQLAEMSFNEVDVSKIKVGQKATLTFDAVSDLEITGIVGEIDALGTVSQGVVNYTVKIIFDTQDDRVKPGMSVSADIITDIKQDVLIVPNSAVKTQGATHSVEMFSAPLAGSTSPLGAPSATPPNQQMVQIGLSNDTDTEIISGLNEGDQIVIKTIQPTATKAATTQTAPSLFPTGGGGGGNRTFQTNIGR